MDPRPPLVAAHPDLRNGVWILRVECPYCGKMHCHGGGDGATPDLTGHRKQHCTEKTGGHLPGYELCYVDAAVNWQAERDYARDLIEGIRAKRRSEEERQHQDSVRRIREINAEVAKLRVSERQQQRADRMAAAALAFI